MKTVLGLGVGAAAAAALFGFAAPAQAQSSWSFGLSVGNGGYYSRPYYDPFYAPYYPSRRAWRSCRRDPWCDPFYNPYPVYAPPIVYAPPPVIVYETRDRYDPLPRWRETVPGYGYGYDNGYYRPYSDTPDYDAQIYAEPYAVAGGAPATTATGAVRYDLAQQGYTADELQSYRDSLNRSGYQPYSAYGSGSADSYIRGSDPDQALLGGPR